MQEPRSTPNADRLAEQGIILCNWNDIHEPGVYVDTEYPRYFRVTEDAIIPDGSPVIHGSEFIVARISGDVSLGTGQNSGFVRRSQPAHSGTNQSIKGDFS